MKTEKDKIKETMVSLKYLNLMIKKAIQSERARIKEEIGKIDIEEFMGEYCFKARTFKQELLKAIREKQ